MHQVVPSVPVAELLDQMRRRRNPRRPRTAKRVVEVRGNGVIKHIIDGETVLEYSQPQLDGRDAHAKELAEKAGTLMLRGGSISLQSESHPIHFRKVELMVLEQ